MKKTLLAAALFAGFAGAAQADTTVTLYGILDTGIEYLNAKNSVGGSYSAVGLEGGGVQAGSRLGVKGTEDLGGGNQAWFNAAMGFNINDGASLQSNRTFGRNALVGLQNPTWGRLQFGRSTSIANDLMSGTNYSGGAQNPGYADPFGTGYNVLGLGATATALNTNRWDNMIGYTSPIFGGFQFGVDYSFNAADNSQITTGTAYPQGVTVPGTNVGGGAYQPMGTRTRAFDLAGTYNNGPLFLGLTYTQVMTAGAALAGTITNTSNTIGGTGTKYASQGSVRQLTLAGSYDFTVLRVYGAYTRGWNGVPGGTSGAVAWTPGAGVPPSYLGYINLAGDTVYSGMKQSAFMLGVSAPVTANFKVMAEYQHQTLGGAGNYYTAANTTLSGLGSTAKVSGSAENIFSVGGIYSLSKRTSVYAVGGYVNGAQNISGQKETVLFAGLNHSF